MYTDKITLFNHHKSGTVDMWYPSILHNVNLNMDKAAIIAKYGAESKDNAVLGVKYHIVDGNKMVGDKIWLPPREWQKQDEESLALTLTFTSGQQFDFFMLEEYENMSPISDGDYKDGFFNYMNKNHDYVFAISTATFFSAIPHFEITAT